MNSWDSTSWFRIWRSQTPGLKAVSSNASPGWTIRSLVGDGRVKEGVESYRMEPMSPLNSPHFFCLHASIVYTENSWASWSSNDEFLRFFPTRFSKTRWRTFHLRLFCLPFFTARWCWTPTWGTRSPCLSSRTRSTGATGAGRRSRAATSSTARTGRFRSRPRAPWKGWVLKFVMEKNSRLVFHSSWW